MSVKYFCAQILSLNILRFLENKHNFDDSYFSPEIIGICALIKIFLGKLHNHKHGWLLDHKKSIQRNSALMSHAEKCSNSIREKAKQARLELSRNKQFCKNKQKWTFLYA